jgi:hypothetical protein
MKHKWNHTYVSVRRAGWSKIVWHGIGATRRRVRRSDKGRFTQFVHFITVEVVVVSYYFNGFSEDGS